MKSLFLLFLLTVFAVLSVNQLSAQPTTKSILRKKYETERKALRQGWQQTMADFERNFKRSQAIINPRREMQLKKNKATSALTSIDVNLDSNYVIVEAIAAGGDKKTAIALVEKAVANSLLEKSKEITHTTTPKDISRLKSFINANVTPLIKKTTYLSTNQVQARFKVQQPLLGKQGLLQFFPEEATSSIEPERSNPVEKTDFRFTEYTGLIIDARQHHPGLNLIIYIKYNQTVLYGPALVDRQKAIELGLAKWHSNIIEAKQAANAGSNPYILVPERIEKNRIYFINERDHQILSSIHFQKNILKNCRVIVLK